MSKKILITTLIIIAVLGTLFFVFFLNPQQEEDGALGIFNFFPFGKATISTSSRETSETGLLDKTSDGLAALPVPVLRKVSDTAVAGATLLETASSTDILYIERGTGHIYNTSIDSLVQKKISNTTIPKIYETLWIDSEPALIIRFLKEDNETIESFYAKLLTQQEKETDLSNLEGTFLSTNITEITVSPDSKKIFSITETAMGGVGKVSNPDGTEEEAFFLPVKEWLISWPQTNIITLTTKPSSQAEGYLYFLNTTTGGLTKILGGIFGLTTLANEDGQKILYSESKNKKINLFLFDRKTNKIIDISLPTLPEKCVWSQKDKVSLYCAVPYSIQNGDYPDSWYQGTVSFNDSLWKINTDTGETEMLYDFNKENEKIDMIKPLLNKQNSFLIFTNKKDLSLWSLRLNSN
ncbi:MAG: hypothetical protein KAR00_03590 [Candidatus Pacebacteria bacterium]|nr:hypothetical protein [Candidatus Paceibacterota bacterium]